jgi:predicted acylesterase/phospholipase RssA
MIKKIITAISGGGAKGVGIPGTQFALQLLGYESEHIIGTSVGGITGFFSLLLYDNFKNYIDGKTSNFLRTKWMSLTFEFSPKILLISCNDFCFNI